MKRFESSSSKKKRIILTGVGIVLVSMSVLFVERQWQLRQEAKQEALVKDVALFTDETESVSVYVAKDNYIAGTEVTEDMFEQRDVNKEEISGEVAGTEALSEQCLAQGIQKEEILYVDHLMDKKQLAPTEGRLIEYTLVEGCMPKLMDITNHYIDIVTLKIGDLDQVVVAKCKVLATDEQNILLNLSEDEIERLKEVDTQTLYLRVYMSEAQMPSEVTYVPIKEEVTWVN